jgi:hypothetical protein
MEGDGNGLTRATQTISFFVIFRREEQLLVVGVFAGATN